VLLTFNRPETTESVFAEIAKAKPSKLLVVSDGPRADRPGDAEKVAMTRSVVGRVDWDCDISTNFSDVNLGAKIRISSGLDWAFTQVSEAIILEDDCVPDQTFFRFCQELLDVYRHDQRVGMISGDNFQFGRRRNQDSYYFSRYGHIWGWATWRDRWVGCYDVNMSKWPRIRDEGWINDLVGSKKEAGYWHRIFERTYRGDFDAWDYQWVLTNWIEGRASIVPAVNMISNIGFNKDATHTTGASDIANLPRVPSVFPLKHPIGRFKNMEADEFSYHKCFGIPLLKRVSNKLAGGF
jgi:hypothetical protein